MAKTRGATSAQPLPGGIVTAMFTDIVDSTLKYFRSARDVAVR